MGMTPGRLAAAQREIQQIVSQGKTMTLAKPSTSRNKLGEPTGSESTASYRIYPLRFTPFSRKLSGQISWADDVNAIAFMAKADADAASETVDDLKQYKTATIDGTEYQIDQVDNYGAFGSDFLYIIVGLKK
ncbi:MAG: hypothetical protein ACO1HP_14770 [Bacteroidota bacterium]